MRYIGGGVSRPNVMPAKCFPNVIPDKTPWVIHDYCDKCGGLMNVRTKTLFKKRYRNKIYCENCYELLSKEEKAFNGKNTIRRGGRIIKDCETKNDIPTTTINKKENTTCKFGVVRTNGVTIKLCKD